MSGYVQISHRGSLFFSSHKFLFWRTFGGQNEKLEDLEDKLANWRTSSELEDTCALWKGLGVVIGPEAAAEAWVLALVGTNIAMVGSSCLKYFK